LGIWCSQAVMMRVPRWGPAPVAAVQRSAHQPCEIRILPNEPIFKGYLSAQAVSDRLSKYQNKAHTLSPSVNNAIRLSAWLTSTASQPNVS
jgi:hypothetical protein